jgi:hypothetical protein
MGRPPLSINASMKVRMLRAYRIIITALLGVAVVGIASGYVLTYPDQLGICSFDSIGSCVIPHAATFGRPLLVGFIPFAGFLLFLLFMPVRLFYHWAVFASVYLPIAFLFVLIADPHGGVYSHNIDREFMVWLVMTLFLIMSFGIIIFHVITQKHE